MSDEAPRQASNEKQQQQQQQQQQQPQILPLSVDAGSHTLRRAAAHGDDCGTGTEFFVRMHAT